MKVILSDNNADNPLTNTISFDVKIEEIPVEEVKDEEEVVVDEAPEDSSFNFDWDKETHKGNSIGSSSQIVPTFEEAPKIPSLSIKEVSALA